MGGGGGSSFVDVWCGLPEPHISRGSKAGSNMNTLNENKSIFCSEHVLKYIEITGNLINNSDILSS